jgi:hypothetical protein
VLSRGGEGYAPEILGSSSAAALGHPRRLGQLHSPDSGRDRRHHPGAATLESLWVTNATRKAPRRLVTLRSWVL